MNAGRPLQQLAACFVLPVEDSLSSGLGGGETASVDPPIRAAAPDSPSAAFGRKTTWFPRLRYRLRAGVIHAHFNMATDVIKQGGTRRGANMGILRVDHPDILEFIGLKQDQSAMNNFNLSVGITSDFMRALARNRHYPLINRQSETDR